MTHIAKSFSAENSFFWDENYRLPQRVLPELKLISLKRPWAHPARSEGAAKRRMRSSLPFDSWEMWQQLELTAAETRFSRAQLVSSTFYSRTIVTFFLPLFGSLSRQDFFPVDRHKALRIQFRGSFLWLTAAMQWDQIEEFILEMYYMAPRLGFRENYLPQSISTDFKIRSVFSWCPGKASFVWNIFIKPGQSVQQSIQPGSSNVLFGGKTERP